MEDQLLYGDLTYNIRRCIFNVHNRIGVGFDEETYHQGLIRKFKEKGMTIPVHYFDELIRTYKMRHFLIENKIICGISALQNTITHHDISTIKSYLQALKLKIGLAINFGKSKLEIKGVRGN